MRIVSTNRKARHDYHILETFEAGIELKGMEVKSLRNKGCSLDGSFARIEGEELFLYNMNISEFDKSSYFRVAPKRTRRLLLHKKEIKKLIGTAAQKGLTLIPLKVFFNDRGWAKIEIALARGKKSYDKRRKLKEDIAKREADRAMKKYRKRY